MTLLQISEKIRDHLINQKAKSENNSGWCKYRNENGKMCAVGCVITDEVYSPELESKSMGRDEIIKAVGLSLKMKLDVNTIALLKAWQQYHDGAYAQYIAIDNVLRVNYERWITEGAEPDSKQSPSAMHEHLKTLKQYDMTGEITKRYIDQVSLYVADHLLKQGKRAVDSQGACQYRTGDGCMCAVGVLIDSGRYNDSIEGATLSGGHVRALVAESLGLDALLLEYGTPMWKMLRSWQRYHDSRESTFSKEEIDARYQFIKLLLDNKHEFPDLKD